MNQFNIGVAVPAFELDFWGRIRNLSDAARADQLTAAYSRAVQEAFREIADAFAGRRTYAEQIAAQERLVTSQRRLGGACPRSAHIEARIARRHANPRIRGKCDRGDPRGNG